MSAENIVILVQGHNAIITMFSRRTASQAAVTIAMTNNDTSFDTANDNNTMEDMSSHNNPSIAASLAQTLVSTMETGVVHAIAHWKVLLLGQGVAIVLAIAGATNEILATECKVSAPSLYNACGFATVGLFGAIKFRIDARKSRLTMNSAIEQGNTLALQEEQESFHTANNSHQEVNDSFQTANGSTSNNDEVDDDELTMDDGELTTAPRSIFSLRNRNSRMRMNERFNTNKSHGSNSKLKATYPFCFGLFTIHAPWYYYAVVSLIEAQAYYFIFLAFRYTSFAFGKYTLCAVGMVEEYPNVGITVG